MTLHKLVYLAFLVFFSFTNCAVKNVMLLSKTTDPKPLIIKNNQLSMKKKGSLLILPFINKDIFVENGAKTSGDSEKPKEVQVVTSGSIYSFLEKFFLTKGYNVISNSVIARIETEISEKKKDEFSGNTYFLEEKALILGRKTGADYILSINLFQFLQVDFINYLLSEDGLTKFYEFNLYNELDFEKNKNLDKSCIKKLKLNLVKLEAEFIETEKGSIIWKGYEELDSRTILPRNWTSSYKDCELTEISFYLDKFLFDPIELNKQIEMTFKLLFSDL